MSSPKPLKLYSHYGAPNPFKVRIVLEKLGVPYTIELVEFADVKKPEYEAVNPNGRLPTLIDSNTGITIWESGAIILYLIENYDKEHRLSSADTVEKWQLLQWLFFQTTGQGPYFGQARWFKGFHHEHLPSAIERYEKEIRRVTMVLDRELAKREWLVGGKCTFADLVFSPWHWVIQGTDEPMWKSLEDEYPHWRAWKDRIEADPVVKKLHEERTEGFRKAAEAAAAAAQK